MDLHALTIHQAHTLLRRGETSSVDLTRAVLARVEAVEGRVQAYLRTVPERALAQAAEADRRRAAGGDHPLLGIPLAIKDVFCTEGIETTCASRMLAGFVPPYTATAVARLERLGAVIIGKTNTDEFAMGSSTETSAFQVTHNPWDLSRVPGGSSGGSAAATAAGECLGGLGSDTGGSVRQPAAHCGVVGLKPTYGRVSRYGLVAFASSLDQVGPLAKDVEDAALLLEAIAGHDPADATSAERPVPRYTAALTGDVRGLRIGVPKEYMAAGLQPEVAAAVQAALAVWQGLGAQIVDVSLPHTEYALPAYYLLATAEASANLARFDGMRYGASSPQAQDIWDAFRLSREAGFGPEVKRRIMLGTYALSAGYYDAYYLKAQKVRTLIRQDFDEALQLCDVLAAPTTPTTAFRIGEKASDPLQMYLSDLLTLSLNLAGLPGISIPCGYADGLPIGLQVMGGAFEEECILRAAHAYEVATNWRRRQPSL